MQLALYDSVKVYDKTMKQQNVKTKIVRSCDKETFSRECFACLSKGYILQKCTRRILPTHFGRNIVYVAFFEKNVLNIY